MQICTKLLSALQPPNLPDRQGRGRKATDEQRYGAERMVGTVGEESMLSPSLFSFPREFAGSSCKAYDNSMYHFTSGFPYAYLRRLWSLLPQSPLRASPRTLPSQRPHCRLTYNIISKIKSFWYWKKKTRNAKSTPHVRCLFIQKTIAINIPSRNLKQRRMSLILNSSRSKKNNHTNCGSSYQTLKKNARWWGVTTKPKRQQMHHEHPQEMLIHPKAIMK